MNISYISCHSVLQVDDVKLLTELGHNVTIIEPSDKQPRHLMADQIICVHRIDWMDFLFKNGYSNVVYRSIGQSHPALEEYLAYWKHEGRLKITRLSPQEQMLTTYAGSDGLIRCSKDENVYKGWTGGDNRVAIFCNHIMNRQVHCSLRAIRRVTEGLPRIMYGWGNESLDDIPTQELKFEDIPDVMRKADVVLYTGTFPSPYSLSFVELLMTGVPIVSIGQNLFYEGHHYWGDMFEVPHILDSKDITPWREACGAWDNNIQGLRHILRNYLEETPTQLSSFAQERARELFSESVVKQQWEKVLTT